MVIKVMSKVVTVWADGPGWGAVSLNRLIGHVQDIDLADYVSRILDERLPELLRGRVRVTAGDPDCDVEIAQCPRCGWFHRAPAGRDPLKRGCLACGWGTEEDEGEES